MAEFDPYAPAEPTGNYLGYSRGSLPDTSIGSLFSDLGTTLRESVRAKQQLAVYQIGEQVRNAAEPIQDVFTGRADFDAVRGGGRLSLLGPDSPRELQEYATRLEALSQARAAGRVRDSHYWTLLDMEARKIRQRFPGFRHEIDQAMSQVTGQIPANALINSLDTEARAGRTSAETERRHWIDKATAVGQAYDLIDRERAGRPVTNEELQLRVNTVNAEKVIREAEQARYTLERARNERNTDNAMRDATVGLSFRMAHLINAATGPFGPSARELHEAIQRYEQTPINQRDPAALTNLVSQWNSMATVARQQAELYMDTPLIEGDANSTPRARINDPTKVKNLLDMYMAQYENIGAELTRGDTGLIRQFKLQNELMLEGNVSQILERSTYFQDMQAINRIAGPQAAAAIYGNATAFGDIRRELDLIRANRQVRIGLPGERGNTIARVVEELSGRNPSPEELNKQTRTVVDNAVRVLSHPEANSELIANHLNNMFGPGNENLLSRFTDKSAVYRQLVGNPEAVANIMKLKDTHPVAYNNYRRWALREFGSLMTEQISNANDIVIANNTELRLDPATWTFSLEGDRFTAGQRNTVRILNNTLSGVRALLTSELTQPWEAETALTQLMDGLNMNRARPAGGVWETMINRMADLTGHRRAYGPGTENVQPGHYASVLDRIALPESGRHGYEAIYSPSGGQRVPGLEQMTLSQVRRYQRNYIAQGGTESSAIGKYQFTQATFDRIMTKLNLDPETTVFNRATQDRMAVELLRERGLDRYLANPSPAARERLLDALAQEWASVGDRTGRSMHAGVAGNRAAAGQREALGRIIDRMAADASRNRQ